MAGFATRLYRGEANFNIVGRRRLWFQIAGAVGLIAILSVILLPLNAGIEFRGGNEFRVPASVGSIETVHAAVEEAVHEVNPDAGEVHAGQRIGQGDGAAYSVRTPTLTPEEQAQVKADIVERFGLSPDQVADNLVSASWGGQVTQQALISLLVFLAAVTTYLAFRFEWRMAVAALASLIFDLAVTAGVYSLSRFEVTPNTVIGFLTILGFALYDVVVVFDKVQENTRGITGKSNETYAEATNLALNQTFMRSINTSLVALLPVGGLLFIGAGLLGAGTLKDLGLVLFIGMGVAVYSSLFFASPLLVWLKHMDPAIQNHTKRVTIRRASLAAKAAAPAAAMAGAGAKTAKTPAPSAPSPVESGVAAAAPKAVAKPQAKAQNKATHKAAAKSSRSGGGKRRR